MERHRFLWIFCFVTALAACGGGGGGAGGGSLPAINPQPSQGTTTQSKPSSSPQPTITSTPISVGTPPRHSTPTPHPTPTPRPTATPSPTPTPQHTATPSPTPSPVGSSTPDILTHYVIQPPSNGVYVGAGVLDLPAALEQSTNRVLQVSLHNTHTFFDFSTVNEREMGNDGPMGRISLLSLDCDGVNATAIANGTYDSTLDAQAQGVKALGYNVMIRIWREMNFNMNGRNANNNNCFTPGDTVAQAQAEYVALYRHIVTVYAKQGVRNVTWLWCPAIGPGAPKMINVPLLQGFYPGDAYVDWVCADAYDKPAPGYGVNYVWGSGNPNDNPSQFLASFHKPAIIAETGECNVAEVYSCIGFTYSQANYLAGMAAAMQPGGMLYPTVKAFLYFDISDPRGWDFELDSGGMSAFTTMLHTPFYNPLGCSSVACPQPPAALED